MAAATPNAYSSSSLEKYVLSHKNRDPEVWKLGKQLQRSMNWFVEEVDLSHDRVDFDKKLTPGERKWLKRVLAFFAVSDGLVFENLNVSLAATTDRADVLYVYALQEANEAVHSEMYAELIETLVPGGLASITDKDIMGKIEWARRFMDPELPLAERLLAWACVEGIFFSSSFAAVFFFRQRGLLPGLCMANEFIARDEGLHCQFAYLRYKQECHPLKEERAQAIVREAVEAEVAFVREALQLELMGMNAGMMVDYVRFVADVLLVMAGHEKVFGVKNPLPWMESISLEGKTNFFERRVSEYSKTPGTLEDIGAAFAGDMDF